AVAMLDLLDVAAHRELAAYDDRAVEMGRRCPAAQAEDEEPADQRARGEFQIDRVTSATGVGQAVHDDTLTGRRPFSRRIVSRGPKAVCRPPDRTRMRSQP